jgi:hypothetical protein
MRIPDIQKKTLSIDEPASRCTIQCNTPADAGDAQNEHWFPKKLIIFQTVYITYLESPAPTS